MQSPSQSTTKQLPPGQEAIPRFPRFGTHLHLPPPEVPSDFVLDVAGAVTEPVALSLAELAELPRRQQTNDFHCVAGWTATDLQWEGVPFSDFYRLVVEPRLAAGSKPITHVAFRGLDGYRAVLALEDALGEDVMIAEHLNGEPLTPDHGSPIRLVSPRQYGFTNVKHLCRIEVLTAEPPEGYGAPSRFAETMLRTLIKPHRRARVWEEERHRYVPGRLVRPLYKLTIPPGFRICKTRPDTPDTPESATKSDR